MDGSLMVLQYMHKRVVQVMVKTLVYSIKLKLELAVLRKMVDFAGGRNAITISVDNGPPTSQLESPIILDRSIWRPTLNIQSQSGHGAMKAPPTISTSAYSLQSPSPL